MKRLHLLAILLGLVTSGEADADAAACNGSDSPRSSYGECLGIAKGNATREGHTLKLKFANGRTKSFTTDKASCDEQIHQKCVIYTLDQYRADSGFFVVGQGFTEGGSVSVISQRTGKSVELEGDPVFSPDGKHFVTVESSESDPVTREFTLWEVRQDLPKMLLIRRRTSEPSEAYEDWRLKGWESNDTVNLEVTYSLGTKNSDPTPAKLRKVDGKWRLEGPLDLPTRPTKPLPKGSTAAGSR